MPAPLDPPYLRIVTDIRRRITSGELRPGDPVPSTRRIAREWGVALATATKALSVLRQEGHVRARARVGTVVASPDIDHRPVRREAPSTSGDDHDLTRDRIVRVAIEIADRDGFAALSMRGIAARLGVAAMSPYRYVHSKDDLVLLMADAAFGEQALPEEPSDADWRARLEIGARSLWEVFQRHPWLAQLSPLSRPLPVPSLTGHAEWTLSALDGLELDTVTAFNLHVLLYSYVQGIAVNLEREAQAEAATGMTADQWIDTQQPALEAIAGSGRYPTFAKVLGRLGETGYDLDLDELFDLGLQSLMDGFAVLVRARTHPQ